MSTADLLRKAAVVARRIKAAELTEWIKREQFGYQPAESVPVPSYRGPFSVPVLGHYATYGAERRNVPLDSSGAPDEWKSAFKVELRQPVAQLEEMARADGEHAVYWPPSLVGAWNRLEDDGAVVVWEESNLIGARRVLPKHLLIGVIDNVRSTLQTLALELQDTDPQLGEVGSGTTADEAVQQVVTSITNNIFNPEGNLSFGPNAFHASSIAVNDVGALITAAQALGIKDGAVVELAQAATASGTEKQTKLKAFIDKVEAGAFNLAAGITTKVATEELSLLMNQFLGLK